MTKHKTERAIALLRRRLRQTRVNSLEHYWATIVRPKIRQIRQIRQRSNTHE